MEDTKLNDKKKRLIIIVCVLVAFIGITFAYIIAQISGSAIGNANVTADTTDNLQFNIDKDITLTPTQFNVVEGGGGLSDTATGTASLLANSTNKSATFDYYVYFQINTNEYIYTTEDQKPEIVLSITDPTGQPVTSVDGLKYVTAQNADGTTVSGFDITTQSGLFNIASNYEITSSSSTQATEQDWIFTVTFINLTTNQAANGGSTLNAEIILQRDEIETFATYIKSLYTTDGENGLYYHDADMDYGSLIGETFTDRYILTEFAKEDFPGYEKVENDFIKFYCNGVVQDIGSECSSSDQYFIVADSEEIKFETFEKALIPFTQGMPYFEYQYIIDTQIITAHDNSLRYSGGDFVLTDDYTGLYAYVYDIYDGDPDKSGVIKYYCNSEPQSSYVGMPCEDGYYYLDYDENTHYTDKNEAVNKANEDGYIIPFVKNYVCFGSDETTCPYDNLYRIIGVFDGQIKLVKADLATIDLLGEDGDYYDIYNNVYEGLSWFYKGNISLENVAAYNWNGNNYMLALNEVEAGNVWSYSDLNKVNLNTNYINYLNNQNVKWANMIANATWHLGGHDSYGASITPGLLIDYEKSDNKYGNGPSVYQAKIGLMYPTDYAYASDPLLWNNSLASYTFNEDRSSLLNVDNWLNLGIYEWFLTPCSSNGAYAFYVDSYYGAVRGGGTVGGDYVQPMLVRPTFYLNSAVKYVSGTGTQADPYRIAM